MQALTTPTTAGQRALFDKLEQATRDQITARANELYDGTRTVSACWALAFGEWVMPPAEAAAIATALAENVQPARRPRPTIGRLEPGTPVMLRYALRGNDYLDEPAIFVGTTGSGDDRRATFRSMSSDGNGTPASYEWDAYRYGGSWAYGSSAQRLSLLDVLGEPLRCEVCNDAPATRRYRHWQGTGLATCDAHALGDLELQPSLAPNGRYADPAWTETMEVL